MGGFHYNTYSLFIFDQTAIMNQKYFTSHINCCYVYTTAMGQRKGDGYQEIIGLSTPVIIISFIVLN